LSIAEKAEKQKPFLKDELINSDFMFGKFDEEIKYFTEQKYIIEKAEFNVYDIQKQSESICVFARIYFNVKSEKAQDWSQLSFYDLQFILSKGKGGYKICDVIVLDNKYQIPEAVSEHIHDENCTHG
jgi:predicted transport protein